MTTLTKKDVEYNAYKFTGEDLHYNEYMSQSDVIDTLTKFAWPLVNDFQTKLQAVETEKTALIKKLQRCGNCKHFRITTYKGEYTEECDLDCEEVSGCQSACGHWEMEE